MSTAIPQEVRSDLPDATQRLRRIPSATSSIYTTTTIATTNPRRSFESTTTLLARPITSAFTSPLNSTQSFTPTHAFQIQARGHSRLSPPSSTLDQRISIFALPTHTVFTSLPPAWTVTPKYLSIRPSRYSGSCNLVSSDDTEMETPHATIEYKYGIGKPPRISIFSSEVHQEDGVTREEEIILQNKSFFSRAITLTSKHHGTLTWRNGSSSEKKMLGHTSLGVYQKIDNLLLLEGSGGKVVARFIRGEETRTVGSVKNSAGNGGLLEIMIVDGDSGSGENGLEVLVIASCLVMMKKEVDRLRGIQAAAVGLASS